ncbi:MAG TPA: Npt1/Npt2 family nucleotide transporter, partial [Myxococcales bacterium]|nr:Npt1/Npt2 family nucleotide transporter [Myxococcales bacterium]
MLRVLESVFPVRAGERKLTLVLFLQSLLAVGAFVAGRSVRDALFLAHGSRSQLAWMYVASAGAVTAVGLLYNPIAARVRRDLMAISSATLFAAAFIVLWRMERAGAPGVYAALYIYVEVMGALTLVQFWTLCNELFNAREAKRLYGLIGAGGTLSNVIIGLLTSKIALRYGASALLPMCSLLLLGCGVTSFLAGAAGRERLFARAASGRPSPAVRSGGFSRVAHNPHLRGVALLAAITFFTTTLVDFDFKVISAQSFAKDQLAAYFGRFYAVVGVLAVVMQLFGTGRILSRAGVIGALAVLPASLLGANAALVLFPSLWAASLAKGGDTLFRYSINDATTQILYLPVPPQARAPAKAFIDGVVKPMAIGLGGLLLLGYRRWIGENVDSLAWVTLALCAAWVVLVLASRSGYIHSLQENLRQRRLGLDTARYKVQDGSTEAVLLRAIESGDPREVLGALELLPHLEAIQMDDKVESLLEHPAAEVRISTLEYYARRQTLRFANSVFRRFDDPDPRVRAAAIDAFCTLGRDKAVKSVKGFLGDPDPGIR